MIEKMEGRRGKRARRIKKATKLGQIRLFACVRLVQSLTRVALHSAAIVEFTVAPLLHHLHSTVVTSMTAQLKTHSHGSYLHGLLAHKLSCSFLVPNRDLDGY